jgi:hypothetical protein
MVTDAAAYCQRGRGRVVWCEKSGNPDGGWVFPNTHGDPLNIRAFVAAVLKPACRKTGNTFCSDDLGRG